MKGHQLTLFNKFDTLARDMWMFEKDARNKGFKVIAGVDETGRGPLAGPVISAAVVLPPSFPESGVDDSKKLTPKKRADLFAIIYDKALSIGVGIIDPVEIDRTNILQAALLSMSISIDNLCPQPDFLLIDGVFPVSSEIRQRSIPKGDSRSLSIAAASIVAKVTRDRLMERYHEDYPEFGFDAHKGYPTKAHRKAIQKYGCCAIHRQSFKGVREYTRNSG